MGKKGTRGKKQRKKEKGGKRDKEDRVNSERYVLLIWTGDKSKKEITGREKKCQKRGGKRNVLVREHTWCDFWGLPLLSGWGSAGSGKRGSWSLETRMRMSRLSELLLTSF